MGLIIISISLLGIKVWFYYLYHQILYWIGFEHLNCMFCWFKYWHFYRRCYFKSKRRCFKESHLIITKHHCLLTHLKLSLHFHLFFDLNKFWRFHLINHFPQVGHFYLQFHWEPYFNQKFGYHLIWHLH